MGESVKGEGMKPASAFLVLLLSGCFQVQTFAAQEGIAFEATAYCPCSSCCGKWADGFTAYRNWPAEPGMVAVDPKVIPLGSVLLIEGLGYRVAADTGSAIKGRRVDIFFGDHKEALRFGRRKVSVRVMR